MTELTRRCLLLNRSYRSRLARILQESLDRTEPVNDGERFCVLYKIATSMFGQGILTGSRDYNLVLGRRFIAYQMIVEGYSLSAISRKLMKSVASVIHMHKMMQDMFDHPNVFKLEMARWTEFQKLLKQKDDDKTRTIQSNSRGDC